MTDLQTNDLFEAFEYLDELRESGRTNMFGAAQFLVSELEWNRHEAQEATKLWMHTFSSDLSLEERVEKALVEQSA